MADWQLEPVVAHAKLRNTDLELSPGRVFNFPTLTGKSVNMVCSTFFYFFNFFLYVKNMKDEH